MVIQRAHRFRTHILLECLESRVLLSSDTLANHGGGANTGLIDNETVLTPATVLSTQAGSSITTNFGRLFDTFVDGQVYAQILARSNVNITRGSSPGVHDVLYVATEHDSLYAIDAGSGAILWQDNFTQITNPQVTGAPAPTAGVSAIPAGDLLTTNVAPELGILSTPAIDSATNILYLLANTVEFRNGSTPAVGGSDQHFVQRLWAVNLSDGSVAITPSALPMEPASGGMIVGDIIKNDTISTSNYANYKYVAGPYIKGTGNNSDTFNADGTVATTNNADGWTVNSADTTSIFSGTTPSAKGYIAFNSLLQMNRPAVTLVNGEIYLGFASHGDNGPYYGWLLGYSASTLANNAAFVTVPTFNGVTGSAQFNSVGGIWTSGAALTTDGTYLYFTVGNGAFNPSASNFSASYASSDAGNSVQLPLDSNYGDSVLKIALDLNATQSNINLANNLTHPTPTGTYNPDGGYNVNGYGIKVVDYFTPSNVWVLNQKDLDLGSSGVLLIPSTGPGSATAPNGDPMLVFAGKEGRIYLVDANNLGGYNTAYDTGGAPNTSNADPAPFDRVLGEYYYFETLPGNSGTKANSAVESFSSPSYFNGDFYIDLSGAKEMGFNVTSSLPNFFFTSASPRTGVEPAPNMTTSTTFGGRGTTATISSNGFSNAILWNINGTANFTDFLAAYDTSGNILFNSQWTISGQPNNGSDTLEADRAGAAGIKFSVPTVFNGMVYAGTGGVNGNTGLGSVVGYGLLNGYLNSNATYFGAPGNLTTTRTSGGVQLNWSRHSTLETKMEIDRSTDNTNWSVLTYVSNGAAGYVDASASFPTQYFYRVRAVNASRSTVFTNVATAPAVLMGDANVDGHVDNTDLTIVLSHFGSTSSAWTLGNFVGDRTIDLNDLAAVMNHMGASAPITGTALASGTDNPQPVPAGPGGMQDDTGTTPTDTGNPGKTPPPHKKPTLPPRRGRAFFAQKSHH